MTKTIELSGGHCALVDDEDYQYLVDDFNTWFLKPQPRKTLPCGFYAYSQKKKHNIYMHRVVMNAPEDMHVDHINNNGLDNRKANLRLATISQNLANRIFKPSLTGFQGVHPNGKRFRACISAKSIRYELGHFDTAEEAAAAYNSAALEHFGEFAKLNQITQGAS